MTCVECKKKAATVFFKAVVNNKITEMSLCESCARNKGIELTMGQDFLSFSGLFGNLSELAKEFLPVEKKSLRCPACGLKYSQFKETGRLGCPECYKSFEPQLTQLLTRIHGCSSHSGKKYETCAPDGAAGGELSARLLDALKKELKAAVAREDFETAAGLRDKIRNCEGKNNAA